MITLEQINHEISMLEAEPPTFASMSKLADLYVVRSNISHTGNNTSIIDVGGDSEFMSIACGKNYADVMLIIDELMSVLQAINPKLYNCVIRKISEGL